MTLSEYCKQKDRIKEELKWKRLELEAIEQDIADLEAEWDKLHGESNG